MKPLFEDTSPEAERVLIEGLRKMTPSEKFQRIGEMNRMAYQLVLADVQSRYPTESQREWDLRIASRSLSAEIMLKVFGWDVQEKGY
jgi:hypothetical protein